ncbi:MAG: trehalose-phosphatase [Scytonema sp. PMC 1069.18]|nr:trehalose-phosphatase [Scytonema sp. PMC 1069.18]MEC4882791.1 trehalose-phosphatase [Scytonema sp. PMC 1070.18]
MQILSPQLDLNSFFARLTNVKQRVLMLDYDGTLAPFRVEREQAFPYPKVLELLNDILQTRTTRIVIISGRSIEDLTPLIHLEPLPEIWGSHGWEHLSVDGKYEITPMDDCTKQALAEAQEYIVSLGLLDYCEHKPASIAMHWRGLTPELANSIHTKVIEHWRKLLEQTQLKIHPFDGGIELRALGKNKGTTVQTIISNIQEESILVYLGDDLTDEDAFKAIKDKGMSILVREELRSTNAELWLKPPEELLEFLSNWKDACIISLFKGNLEDAALHILEQLGEIKRPYLTLLEEQLLSLLEREYRVG